MISKTEYNALRNKYDAYHAAREAQYPKINCFTPAMQATLPLSPSNEEISAIELYEWQHDPPARYFCYINDKNHTATTFAGDYLGLISLGHVYRSPFGDKRQSVTLSGSNGCNYYGTYYTDAGDYARIKITVASKRALGLL